MDSWPASRFYKGKTCYGTGYEMIDEIDRLKNCINAFMAATSDESGWGKIGRMDAPELYSEIAAARALATTPNTEGE